MDRDALERRYDGPIPPADPALAGRPPAAARARLFERLAAEARAQAARRRGQHDFAGGHRAARLLACYRQHGVAWLCHAGGGVAGPAPGEPVAAQPTM